MQRNPIIADVFHRTGLIERWGRGTNRVAEMCEAADIAPPEFREITGAAVVTFRVPVAWALHPTPQVTPQVATLLGVLASRGALSGSELRVTLGLKDRMHLHRAFIGPALAAGLAEMTVAGKPNSRLQKYRLTATGRAALPKGASS